MLFLRVKDGTSVYDTAIDCVESNLEHLPLRDGYSWLSETSIEGYELEASTGSVLTAKDVLFSLENWAGAQPVEWLNRWDSKIALIRAAMQWWASPSHSTSKAKIIELVETLRTEDGAEEPIIDFLISSIDQVPE
jgi:hypothetical protein